MKILHTADWHLGRLFEGQSLDEDHTHVLDQVFRAVVEHKPAALIIAGDIFDRASPPVEAVRLFNGFVARLVSETRTALVVIAGNHDSPERIGAMAMLADRRRALVRGPLEKTEHPLILEDEHGAVAISGLPFAYEHAARECFETASIKSPEDVLRAEVEAARPHIPKGARWIIVAHAFVTGANPSEVERTLTRAPVGGVETVSANIFDGAHYVALGHLHRPQAIGGEHIRYSGAPLAFGYDEEGSRKSMVLVSLDQTGATEIELLPITPRRDVRTLKGTLAEILAMPTSEDFVQVHLDDEGRLVDPMKRIRARFPNATRLAYARDLRAPETKSVPRSAKLEQPEDIIAAFVRDVRGTPLSVREQAIVDDALDALRGANP